MSAQATELRLKRRAWAVAGSRHDRLIAALRIALPAAIGVLAAFLALAPLTGRDISFVLSKDRVDVAPERMRVTRAVYRGRDAKGQPFQLDSASAVQTSSRDPIVRLHALNARIQLQDGPAVIAAGHLGREVEHDIDAGRGRYDMDTQRIAIDGPVTMTQSGGYRVLTRDILFDMNSKQGVSRGAVDGRMNLGTFRADRLRTNLETRVVNLDGRARLHIVQSRARARR